MSLIDRRPPAGMPEREGGTEPQGRVAQAGDGSGQQIGKCV